MEKVSKITKDTFGSKSIKKAAEAAFVCNVAKKTLQDFFDRDFLQEVEIISFRSGNLFIKTPNNFCSQEIKLKEKEILGKANWCLGDDLIETVRFKQKSMKK